MMSFQKKITSWLSRPELIALPLLLLFGTISAFTVPQMTVNDEGAHLLKAFSLSEGKLSGRTCDFPRSIVNEASSSLEKSYPSSSASINYQDITQTSCGSAAGYSPIMHVPQTIGIVTGKIFNASPDMLVLLGRLANMVFYSVSIFFIIRFVRIGKWAMFVIGLFPIMIHIAGSLSADTVNNVIVMTFVAFMINLFTQKDRLSKVQLFYLLGLCALLAMTKPTNLILLLPMAALPVHLVKKNPGSKLPFNTHKWLIAISCIVVGVLVTLAMQMLLGSMLFREVEVQNPLISDPLRFIPIIYNTYINPTLGYGDLLARGIIGEFSSFKYHLPTFIVFAEFIALGIALLYKPNNRRENLNNQKAFALLSIATLVLFTSAITLALFSAWAILPNRLGAGAFYADGVQGRYFTAVLALLIPIGFWLRNWVSIRSRSDTVIYACIVAVSLASLLFYLAQTQLTFA